MNEFQKQLLSELRELNKTLKVIASNQERKKENLKISGKNIKNTMCNEINDRLSENRSTIL